jgi:hypothetical protein
MLPNASPGSVFHAFHFPFFPPGNSARRLSVVSSFICWMAI